MPPQLESGGILPRKSLRYQGKCEGSGTIFRNHRFGWQDLAVVEVVDDGEPRRPNVEHGGNPLQSMVPGFVKKVAESNNSCGFASEIDRQPCGAAAEKAGYRVQFFSAVLQNRPGQSKISRAENSNRREKSPILRVPKPML